MVAISRKRLCVTVMDIIYEYPPRKKYFIFFFHGQYTKNLYHAQTDCYESFFFFAFVYVVAFV